LPAPRGRRRWAAGRPQRSWQLQAAAGGQGRGADQAGGVLPAGVIPNGLPPSTSGADASSSSPPEQPLVLIYQQRNTFGLVADVLAVADKVRVFVGAVL